MKKLLVAALAAAALAPRAFAAQTGIDVPALQDLEPAPVSAAALPDPAAGLAPAGLPASALSIEPIAALPAAELQARPASAAAAPAPVIRDARAAAKDEGAARAYFDASAAREGSAEPVAEPLPVSAPMRAALQPSTAASPARSAVPARGRRLFSQRGEIDSALLLYVGAIAAGAFLHALPWWALLLAFVGGVYAFGSGINRGTNGSGLLPEGAIPFGLFFALAGLFGLIAKGVAHLL